MKTTVTRRTVHLSSYPDLVVIYLGMRVNRLAGIKTLFGFGPKISTVVEAQPDGLLLHENVVWSLFPPHAGMRQYCGTSSHWNAGRDRSRTSSGGRTSFGTRGARVSGTRPTS